MASNQTQKFRLENMDCAACAGRIERRLNAMDTVDEASVDFANLTLHLRTSDLPSALAAVTQAEPGVRVLPASQAVATSAPHSHGASELRSQLAVIAAAGAMFLVLLLLEKQFHRLPWPGMEYVVAVLAWLLAGWSVITGAARTMRRGLVFDENVLMVIATVGALAIHALPEAVGVMLFFRIGELLQDLAVSKSRRSLQALLAARPNRAWLQTDAGIVETAPEQITIGQRILVKPGEKIALDGTVIDGSSRVDTSPLTGESVPVQVRPGDTVMAGTVNTAAALTVQVTKPFAESSISRVLELVESAASRKAATERFITTLARYYTPAVVAIAAAIAFLPPLLLPDALFSTWIYRALVLLVISCPCALVISIPLGYFGGIGRASREGILVKGSMFIDALAELTTVVLDKTGTLTRGVFQVSEVVPRNGFTAGQLLQWAAAAELHSDHPIGKSIGDAARERAISIDATHVGEHTVVPGKGVQANVDGVQVTVGNDALLHDMQIEHDQCVVAGTVAHVVVDGRYAGYILISDQLKPDARAAVDELRSNGVKRIIMLTGDNENAAAAVAEALQLDEFHAGLMPEDKVRVFEQISAQAGGRGKIAFVGDGINDAPVLARADVGIAMGAFGSDAAIETADVVLMTDAPSKIAEAVRIARHTRRIVWQNIALALAVKGVFIFLGSLGMATMWEAVFADMGTALLALLNATRAFRRGPGPRRAD